MKMRAICGLAMLVVLVGCAKYEKYGPHSEYFKKGEELIYCSSKVNDPNEILYYKSQQLLNNIDVPQSAESFKSYYITDVEGNVYAINSDEMDNYMCFNLSADK